MIGTRLVASSDSDGALPCEDPVILCAAGWRSGSTLLQRMCMGDPGIMVWGEPLDRCGVLQTLAGQWSPVTEEWPNPRHLLSPDRGVPGVDEWIANLSPSPASLRAAQRAYLDALLGAPARAAGRGRWGLKEVRLGGAEIRCLRMLFPSARFVLLVRDPVRAFESYAPRGPWFERWPAQTVATAAEFADLWSRQVAEFLSLADGSEFLLTRYEDLETRRDELASHLDLDLARPSSLAAIRGNAKVDESLRATDAERRQIRDATGNLAIRLGYQPP